MLLFRDVEHWFELGAFNTVSWAEEINPDLWTSSQPSKNIGQSDWKQNQIQNDMNLRTLNLTTVGPMVPKRSPFPFNDAKPGVPNVKAEPCGAPRASRRLPHFQPWASRPGDEETTHNLRQQIYNIIINHLSYSKDMTFMTLTFILIWHIIRTKMICFTCWKRSLEPSLCGCTHSSRIWVPCWKRSKAECAKWGYIWLYHHIIISYQSKAPDMFQIVSATTEPKTCPCFHNFKGWFLEDLRVSKT